MHQRGMKLDHTARVSLQECCNQGGPTAHEALAELNHRYGMDTAPFDQQGRELGHNNAAYPTSSWGPNASGTGNSNTHSNTNNANDARSSTGKMPRSHYTNKEYEQRAREQQYYQMQNDAATNTRGSSTGRGGNMYNGGGGNQGSHQGYHGQGGADHGYHGGGSQGG